MAWTFDTFKACYDGDEPVTVLSQYDKFTMGLYYAVEFTLSGITQGGIRLESIEGKPEFTANGIYQVFGKAIQNNLTFTPYEVSGDMFIGCLDDISTRWTPLYRIENADGDIIFQQADNEGVEAAGNNIMYAVDWSEIPVGTYKIKFTDAPLIYASHCLCVKVDPCSVLLSWTNDENAGGFNYSDLDFTQNLRVIARLGEDFGKSIQRDVFRFSDGSKKLLYAERDQEQILTIKEIPRYLHRALMLGIDYDHFSIDAVEQMVDQQDYQPAWRKSSNLAPVTLTVTPKNEGFINQNCS